MSLDESTHVDKGGPSQLPAADAEQPAGRGRSTASDAAHGQRAARGPGGRSSASVTRTARRLASSPPPPASCRARRSRRPRGLRPIRRRSPGARACPRTPVSGHPGVPFPSNPPLPGVLVGGPSRATRLRLPPSMRRMPTPEPVGIAQLASGRRRTPGGEHPRLRQHAELRRGRERRRHRPARCSGCGRKSSVGVWLMAVLLAAAALGGIAFFAVKRGPLADPGNGRGDPVIRAFLPRRRLRRRSPPPQPTVDACPRPSVARRRRRPRRRRRRRRRDAPATPTPPVVTPTPPVRAGSVAVAAGGAGGHAPRSPGRPTSPPTGDTPTASDPAEAAAGRAGARSLRRPRELDVD